MARDIEALYNKIIKGDRIALGQVMTLVESDRAIDRKDAIEILVGVKDYWMLMISLTASPSAEPRVQARALS